MTFREKRIYNSLRSQLAQAIERDEKDSPDGRVDSSSVSRERRLLEAVACVIAAEARE